MSATSQIPPWRGVFNAFCASLIGIGLARFAYTPLLPVLVTQHWFAPSAAAYLGAANLAGYLTGALLGRPLARRVALGTLLPGLMLIATATFFACAWPLGFAWFFLWRGLAGLAGGALMVLAAPAVLPQIALARRGLASGMIFMGVGIGVIVSGALTPLLLQQGLRAAWLGLGALALLLSLAAATAWPVQASLPAAAPAQPARVKGLHALYLEYALNAAGWTPHMIFLVDFVARGLHRGVTLGAACWTLFGVGAAIGPVLAGHVGDRIGFGKALRLAFILEAAAVAAPAIVHADSALIPSSLIVGAFVTGTVPLMLGRLNELMPHHPAQQKAAWSIATVIFALFQAGAAYGLSYIFARSGGDYDLLFLTGAGAMAAALAIDLVASPDRPFPPVFAAGRRRAKTD